MDKACQECGGMTLSRGSVAGKAELVIKPVNQLRPVTTFMRCIDFMLYMQVLVNIKEVLSHLHNCFSYSYFYINCFHTEQIKKKR